jgi:hypothetical protein
MALISILGMFDQGNQVHIDPQRLPQPQNLDLTNQPNEATDFKFLTRWEFIQRRNLEQGGSGDRTICRKRLA